MKNALILATFASLAAPAAMASGLLIDDFSAAGGVVATFQGNPATTNVADAGILGGNRFMWASTDNGGSFGTSFEAVVGSGILNFANASGVFGQAALIYDGGGGGAPFAFTFDSAPTNLISVNTIGLGGEDFLMGNPVGSRSITFSGSDFDQGLSFATFRAYAWDMDGDLATYDEIIGGPDFDEALPLTAFAVTGGTGNGIFDWTMVGAIAFTIESNTQNFDGSLGSIAVVPVPASALLLLGGMGGLAGMSISAKRRRRKA